MSEGKTTFARPLVEVIKPLFIDGMEPVYSLADTARMFNRTPKVMRTWVRTGFIVAKRNGPKLGDIVFYRGDIEAVRNKPVVEKKGRF
jgi:hypothetical protein